MDILKAFGDFNIDNYIGDPSDDSKDKYRKLDDLRSYYFERLDRNINEYIQLVKYIDKSLFDVLHDVAPARAKVSKGLLIEPHFLERSKTRWDRPVSERADYDTSIGINDNNEIESSYETKDAHLDATEVATLGFDYKNIVGTILSDDTTQLDANTAFYDTNIHYMDSSTIEGTAPFYEVSIQIPTGSSLVGEVDSFKSQAIGMDKDSIGNAGFGLFGIDGVSKITTIDSFGNITSSRQNVYLVKEQYVVNVNTQVAGYPTNGALPGERVRYEYIPVTKERYKVTKLPYGGTVTLGNGIVEVTPLNGYFQTHYKYKHNLSEGLERSYHKGSLQDATTTPDGLDPVETFTTNPNILRVAKTGRGSGEPILEVD
jgi:hypothetical protein